MEYKFIPRPEGARNIFPSEARALFRRNGYYGSTSGFCLAYSQANLMVLPDSLAEDFEEFCKKNSGPLPLLFRSKAGECSAPLLAGDLDVKTDLPRYTIYSNGRLVEDTLDLSGFEQSWGDKVSFYIGCSFTFEGVLLSNGIGLKNVELGLNTTMYRTNIQMKTVGCFKGNVIVSMRMIKITQLAKAFLLSALYPKSHGAPIHIGNPALIGVNDLSQPEVGDLPAMVIEGEVPVFWACGMSSQEAVKNAAPRLAFGHYPGSMLITDILAKPSTTTDEVEIVELSRQEQPFFASILESKSANVFAKMEEVLLDDPGKRGIIHLFQKTDFMKSVLALSHASRVAITTGFPCLTDVEVKEETDGLPGALSICQALLALDKDVTLLCDSSSLSLYKSCVDHMVQLGALKSPVPVISCSAAMEVSKLASPGVPAWDVLLAIERAGKNKTGEYCTMRAKPISMEPMDDLFEAARSDHFVSTICIGDGGNELGMGKVYKQVVEHIPEGNTIACATACDYVVACGVSNWAGYAISLGLYVLSCSPMHWRYRNRAIDADQVPDFAMGNFLPTSEQISSLLKHMNILGFSDGVNGRRDQSVDDLPLQFHLNKIKELINCVISR